MILLVLIVFIFCAPAKAQPVDAIEDSILFYISNIQKYSLYFGEYKEGKVDSLDLYNQTLQKYLISVLHSQPLSLEAKFEKLSDKLLRIATSEDKHFRIYFWDEQGGGSMHGYYSLVQYKTSMGVSAEIIYPKAGISKDIAEDKDGPGFFYPKIYTVHAKNNKALYLAIRDGVYSNTDISTGIRAFTVENDKLNDSIKIFKTKTKTLNSIDCSYDYFSNYNTKTTKENYLIHLNDDKQKLFIPVVNGDKMTGRYLVYVFDGNNYVFDKNAK